MNQINRRAAISGVMAGTGAMFTSNLYANGKQEESAEKKDREFVLKAGLTEKEADCWEKTAAAAGAFFDLPELHPMDDHEVASAIHVIQHKLLARPTYRKYLELAKAAHESQK